MATGSLSVAVRGYGSLHDGGNRHPSENLIVKGILLVSPVAALTCVNSVQGGVDAGRAQVGRVIARTFISEATVWRMVDMILPASLAYICRQT
jgi:hypothetical protein